MFKAIVKINFINKREAQGEIRQFYQQSCFTSEIKEWCCDEFRGSEMFDIVIIKDDYSGNQEVGVGICNKTLTYDEEFDETFAEYNEYKQISYCPFCGNELNIELIKGEDKTNEYNELDARIKSVYTQIVNSTSKSNIEKLSNEIDSLENKLLTIDGNLPYWGD